MTRRLFVALLALSVASALLSQPVSATEPDPPGVHTRVIGGRQSTPGQWPWQVAILNAGVPDTYDGFFCGGTIVGPSWILTAAHCVHGLEPGAAALRSEIEVLVGTTVLGDGSGIRARVAGLHVHPGFDAPTSRNDVALLRLAKPTTTAAIPIVAADQAALWAPGTVATVAGWGNTNADPDPNLALYPTRLRDASVPIQADSTCAQKYPPGRVDAGSGESLTFFAASMVCAGPLAGGRDTCNGDSGGPLMVPRPGGGWVQVGVTSWGFRCAQPDNPGVYSRLGAPSMASFVSKTMRFGPYDDAASFISQQFRDFNDRLPTAGESAVWQSFLANNPPRDLISSLESSSSWQDHGWAIARLFGSFFLRDPDRGGLSYWAAQSFAGKPLAAVAANFARSAEFRRRYGTVTNQAFVDLVYRNVLKRPPDQLGRAYWVRRLSTGLPRGSMMVGFSEAHENRMRTDRRTKAITTFFALMRNVPTRAQADAIQTQPIAAIIDLLRGSYGYALRF